MQMIYLHWNIKKIILNKNYHIKVSKILFLNLEFIPLY